MVGSRTIMRRLDELAPEPPLLPAPGDPAYAQVLEAERWGDEVLQSVPRRIIDVAFLRRSGAMESYAGRRQAAAAARDDAPRAAADRASDGAQKQGNATTAARADLDALPGQLDRIDAWIADGLLGGEQPNAADLQIGSHDSPAARRSPTCGR